MIASMASPGPMQQTLVSAIHSVLSAAAEQICGLVEYVVTEYEDLNVSSKLQIETQRRVLDELLRPRVTLHRADISETTASDSWNSARTRRLSSALSVLGRDCNGRPGRRKDSRSSSSSSPSSSAHGELHTEGLATSAAEPRPPPGRPPKPPVDTPSLSPTPEEASSQTHTADGGGSSRPPGVVSGVAKAKSPSLANAAAAAPAVKAKESLPHPSSLSPCHVTVQDSMGSTPVDAMMDRGEAGQMMKPCDRFGPIQTKTKKDAKLDTSVTSCDAEQTSDRSRRVVGNPKSTPSPTVSKTAAPDDCNSVRIQQQQPSCSGKARFYSESQRRTEQQPPAEGRLSEPAADNIPSAPLTRSSTRKYRQQQPGAVRPMKASSDAAGSSSGGKDEETSVQKDSEDGQPSDRGSPDGNPTPTTMVSGMSETSSASRDSGVLAKDSNVFSLTLMSLALLRRRDLCAEGRTGAGEQLPAESPTEVVVMMTTPQPSSAQRGTEQQPPAAGRLSEPAAADIPSALLTRSSSTTTSSRRKYRQPAFRPKKASSDAAGSSGGKAMDRESHQRLQHLFEEDDSEEDFLGFPASDEETSLQKDSEDSQPSDRGSPDSNLTPTTMVSGMSETTLASRNSGVLAKDSNAEPGGSMDSRSSSSTRGDLCAEGLTGTGEQLPVESPTEVEVMMTPQPSSALSMDSSVLAKDSNAEPGGSKDSRTFSAQGELCSEAAEQQPPAHSLSSAEVMAAHPSPALVTDFSILEEYSNADPGGSEESQSSSTRGALFSDGLTRTEKQLPVESPAEVMTPQVSPMALTIDFSVLGKASEAGGSSVEPQSPSTRGELYSDGLTSLDRQLPAESPTGLRDQKPSSDLSVDPGILGKDSLAEPAGSKDSQAPSALGEFYSERLGSTEQQLTAESATDIPPATFARRASNCREYGRPRTASPDTAGNGSHPPVAKRRGKATAAEAAKAAPVVKWRDCTLLKPMSSSSSRTFTDQYSNISMDLAREAIIEATEQRAREQRATEKKKMSLPPVKRSRLPIKDKEGGGVAVDGSLRRIEYFGFEDLGKSDSDEERTQAKVTMEAALSTSMDVLQTQDSQDNQSSSNTDFLHLPVCKEAVSTERRGQREEEELAKRPEEAHCSTLTLPVATSEDYNDSGWTEPRSSTSSETQDGRASQPTGEGQPLGLRWSESDSDNSDEWEETRGGTSSTGHGKTRAVTLHGAKPDAEDGGSESTNTREAPPALQSLRSRGRQQLKGQRLPLSNNEPTMRIRGETRCTVCGKQFRHKSDLIRHKRVHTGKTPFVCTICSASFKQNAYLQKHMTTMHTGKKLFGCTVCGKSFTSGTYLKKHMLSHTDFACTRCDKVFGLKKALTTHMSTHTEKPFSCTVCNKGFGRKDALDVHMSSHFRKKKRKTASRVTILDSTVGRSMDLAREATEKMSTPPVKRSSLAIGDKEGGGLAVDGSSSKIEYFGFEDLGKSDSDEERTQAKVTMEAALSTSMDVLQTQDSQDNQSSSNTEFLHLPVCKEVVSTEGQQRNPILVQEEPAPPPQSRGQQEEEELTKWPEEAHCSTSTLPAATSEDYNDNSWTEPLSSTSSETQDGGASQPTGEGQPLGVRCSESDSDEWEETRGGTSSTGRGKTRAVTPHGAEPDTEGGGSESTNTREAPPALESLRSRGGRQLKGQRLSLSNNEPMMRITGETRCTVCGKQFHDKSKLIRHKTVHTGETPFVCTVCSANFKLNVYLHKHMTTMHTGNKPFSCTVCGKSFTAGACLEKHMLSHTDFACTVCDKVFGLKKALTAHMSTHTAKPFSCTVCNKGFGHKRALYGHMSSHFGEKKRKTASRVPILDSTVGRSMDLAREATREATEKMSTPPVKRSRLAIGDKEGGGVAVDVSSSNMEYFGFEDLGKSDSDEERAQAKVTMEAALSTSMDVLQTQDSQDNQSSSNTDFLHLPVCKEVVSTEGQQRNPILVKEEPAPPPQSRGQWEEEELAKRPEEAHCSTLTLPAATSEDYNDNSWTEPLSSTSSETQDGGASQPTGEGQPLGVRCSESDSDEWEETRGGTSSTGRGKTRAVTSHGAKPDTEDGGSESTNTGEAPAALQSPRARGRRQLKGQSLSLRNNEPTMRIRGETRCTVCGKQFRHKSNLIRHKVIHTGETPFVCTICSASFKQNAYLQKHMTTMHTGNKPFSCTVCGKQFRQKGHLIRHKVIHTGETPFVCTICSASFKQNAYLHKHMTTMHTGNKPFACTVCDKVFGLKKALTAHMSTHTAKPFSCTVCNKGFGHKRALYGHMSSHFGEKNRKRL